MFRLLARALDRHFKEIVRGTKKKKSNSGRCRETGRLTKRRMEYPALELVNVKTS